ncbi:MBL fold metallo-hydrolase [Microbacterium sp. LWH7-1.2]|uniref:MBL fold metallo-hydrolase n=1 Tax=Microbacterium sp. LWH7-1.2 TaxID=3135257 RepID=UPI0031389486
MSLAEELSAELFGPPLPQKGCSILLTKFTHATVRFEKDGHSIITDPGTLSTEAEVLASALGVLVTHDHFDHLDVDAVKEALAMNPQLQVYGPVGLAEIFGSDDCVTEVSPGDSHDIGPFSLRAFGGTHAVVHPDMPAGRDISFLVDGRVFHPGDSYELPGVPVDTLLMPTSGPWTSIGKAIDFIRGVASTRAIQIHEIELSELGQEYAMYFLGVDGVGGVPISKLGYGQSVDV